MIDFKSVIIKIFDRIHSIYWSKIYSQYRKKYAIDPSFRFNGENIIFYQNGEIICGKSSYIGKHSSIQSISGHKVQIGCNCSISHYVHIYTCNNSADQDFANINEKTMGDVLIGDYCWIGIKSSIIGPATIGENAVIGANSLVNRDLPPHSISIGVPARVVKFKSYLSKDEKFKLASKYECVLSAQLKKQMFNRTANAAI